MYYRYDLYLDDEYQGVGFLQGLSELWLDMDIEDDLLGLFKDLPIPNFYMGNKERTKAYFTEKGKQKFKKEIETIINVYNYYGPFTIKEHIDYFSPNEILYQDDYQIIVKE